MTDMTDDDQLLIDLELASSPPKRRFYMEPNEFGERAADTMRDAKHVDGRAVLSLVLESLLLNPTTGKNSGQSRLRRALALILDEKVKGGRPPVRKEEMLRNLTEQVYKKGPGSNGSILAIAASVVEDVTGLENEALAKTIADLFSANRAELLNDYVESRYLHVERRIARLIVDLFDACGLDVDPLITKQITTDPYLGRDVTIEELEDEYEARMEAAARRD